MTIDQYLLTKFLEGHPETLDDDISDKYDSWISTKDATDIIWYLMDAEISKK